MEGDLRVDGGCVWLRGLLYVEGAAERLGRSPRGRRGSMSYQWQEEKQADRQAVIADSLLITRILAGDQSAFEALVHKYERPLRGYIWHILKDEELIADVLQHVFLQLSFCLPKLNANRP